MKLSKLLWLFVVKAFLVSGIIFNLNPATAITEVLGVLITECPTATSKRMGFVSD